MSEPMTIDDFLLEGGRFVIVPYWVFEADMSDGALRLYCVLADFGNRAGRSWPARSTLAERMRCSRDTVDRRREELMRAGLLEVQHRLTADGKRTSNLWILRTRNPQAAPMPRDSRTDAAYPSRTDAAENKNQLEQEGNGRKPAAARSRPEGGSQPPGPPNPVTDAREIRREFEERLAAEGGAVPMPEGLRR